MTTRSPSKTVVLGGIVDDRKDGGRHCPLAAEQPAERRVEVEAPIEQFSQPGRFLDDDDATADERPVVHTSSDVNWGSQEEHSSKNWMQ